MPCFPDYQFTPPARRFVYVVQSGSLLENSIHKMYACTVFSANVKESIM